MKSLSSPKDFFDSSTSKSWKMHWWVLPIWLNFMIILWLRFKHFSWLFASIYHWKGLHKWYENYTLFFFTFLKTMAQNFGMWIIHTFPVFILKWFSRLKRFHICTFCCKNLFLLSIYSEFLTIRGNKLYILNVSSGGEF